MVTEHKKLKFRYFSFLFIIFVTKHNRIYIYLVKEAFKRSTNDYNDVIMYLGHI